MSPRAEPKQLPPKPGRKAKSSADGNSAEIPGVADPLGRQNWTLRLAHLLAEVPAREWQGAALGDLWADHAAEAGKNSERRLDLLMLLTRRQAQLAGRHDPVEVAPLPDWPDSDTPPLPPLHPTGAPGITLITWVGPQDGEALLRTLPGWLATPAGEILILSTGPSLGLVRAMHSAGLTRGGRLRLCEIRGAGANSAEIWNAACRLARCQRLICLPPGSSLAPDYALRAPLPSGRFHLVTGDIAGGDFLLDIDRRDLTSAGGFNEYLPGSAFLAQDLKARLMGLGLVPQEPDKALVSLPIPQAQPAAEGDRLRDLLRAERGYAALVDRHIAALMPDWKGDLLRRFDFDSMGDLGPALRTTDASAHPVPIMVRTTAETRALSDLTAARLGGQPIVLSQRRLDLVLDRPAQDVTLLDVAVAASRAPESVSSRTAWVLVNIAPDAMPVPDSLAEQAFLWIKDRAEILGLSLAISLAEGESAPEVAAFSGLPVLSSDSDLAKGFWPISLRNLVRETPLPHSTLYMDAKFLDEFIRLANEGPVILNRRPRLFIDAQHGLGNRLRAIASAAAIAKATGRELVVVWQPDTHCACTYEDLFVPQGAVLSEGFATEAEAFGIDLFNYMEIEPGSAKDALIRLGGLRDAYLRSAYPLVHPASNWISQNAALRDFRPNEVVMDLVHSVTSKAPDLAVHIRMEGGRAVEHLPYEAATNWPASSHREIDHWRRRSNFRFFLARVDTLLAQGQAESIFLASDTPGVYESFADRYGARISHLPRRVTDRSAQAMVYAFADAILLARAPRILGSTWSSFTELAARLADHPVELELSGRDF